MSLIGKILSGKEFNEIYKDTVFVKLTNCCEEHNGFMFRTGLNVDTVEFNPIGECSAGGIYFTEEKYIYMWTDCCGNKSVQWIRVVTIPDDARVYVEKQKFKADKMILSERSYIWCNEKYYINIIKHNYAYFKFVENPSNEMCKMVLQIDGMYLQYIKKQTPELCSIAILNSWKALKYVNEQTPELCLLAVSQYCQAIEYVVNQTEELCKFSD